MSLRTLVYDTEPCSRCHGSGTYSRCEMWGTTCFKCGGGVPRGTPGSGLQRTRAAERARVKVEAFKETVYRKVPVAALQPGQVILVREGKGRTRRTVVQVTERPDLRWSSRSGDEERSGHYFMVETQKTHMQETDRAVFTLAPTDAEWDDVLEFAGKLKGVRVAEKEVPSGQA